MPVTLTTSDLLLPSEGRQRFWIDAPRLDETMSDVGRELEMAFDAIQAEWTDVGRALAADASAILAHTPACVANASDFGLMLAWSRLVRGWAKAAEPIDVICDDPWLFRQLSGISGVTAGSPPPLWRTAVRLALRGLAARTVVMLRCLRARMTLPKGPEHGVLGRAALLVYGHPDSTVDGEDAYFGNLMHSLNPLCRLLHVDCSADRARQLASQRTASLHAWGPVAALFGLPFAKWRPRREHRVGPHGWLIRRAAALEGGTGQAAMISWQLACQNAWLHRARPRVVAWPWENHAWERAFVRAARARSIRTVGYQHTVVGRREWNYAPDSNPDGLESVPDLILTSGAAGAEALRGWGLPNARIQIGGARRKTNFQPLRHDPTGPVLVALPFDAEISKQMIDAVRPMGAAGHSFLVKGHPMTPYQFVPSDGVEATERPLAHHGGLAAILYCATTVGLEAALGGVPTLRFLPQGKVPVDVLPADAALLSVGAADLAKALAALPPPPLIAAEWFFAAPDTNIWAAALDVPPGSPA